MFNVEIGRTRSGAGYFAEIRYTIQQELVPYEKVFVRRIRHEAKTLIGILDAIIREAITRL